MLNNGKRNLGKFDSKSNKVLFLHYSTIRRPFRVFNRRTILIEEYVNIVFDESITLSSSSDPKKDSIIEFVIKKKSYSR